VALSAFQHELGRKFGRLAVSGAPDGVYVFELGSQIREDVYLEIGNYVQVAQSSIAFDSQATLVRLRIKVALPLVLEGAVWKLSARLNSTTCYTRYLRAEQRGLVLADICIPTIGATGGATNTISVRLTLEAA